MMQPWMMMALLALAGCTGSAYLPGFAPPNLPQYGQATPTYATTSGYAPPGYQQASSYQQAPMSVQVTQDQAPHNYEHTRDLEVRETVPGDVSWCRQPWVALTLQEFGSNRIEREFRQAAAMTGGVETTDRHPDTITAITDMQASPHHCVGLSREECLADASHICRGLVHQASAGNHWTIFVVQHDSFEHTIWRPDRGDWGAFDNPHV